MKLPEFIVSLTRDLEEKGQYFDHSDKFLGRRSKFGGRPNWIQSKDDRVVVCSKCSCEMIFVAQIDSVEHHSRHNPNSVHALGGEQKWMFGDVGMIFVFFCLSCDNAAAIHEGY